METEKNHMPKTPSQLFTISTEALTLWQLENSRERWMDMQERKVNKEPIMETKVETLYTVAGNKGGTKKFGGWTAQGLHRFNYLFDLVVKDRELHGASFDDYYMAKYGDKDNRMSKKAKRCHDDVLMPPPAVRNGLGSHISTASSTPANAAFPPSSVAVDYSSSFAGFPPIGSGFVGTHESNVYNGDDDASASVAELAKKISTDLKGNLTERAQI